jgi:endoglucanase
MTEVGNYLMSSGALFASVFNGSPEYPTLQLTDQASQNVWKGFVAESSRAQSNPGPSPSSPAPSSPAPSSPAPSSPVRTPTPVGSAPAADASWLTGLNLSPAQFAGSGSNHTTIGFRIGQAADVTVLVLAADGTVVRQIAKPTRAAGQVSVPYYGYTDGGTRLPAGAYRVLVVASNASGSASAEATLTISAP